MTWEGVLAWFLIGVGLMLTIRAWLVVRYFRRQISMAGGSWILIAFLRVVLTIMGVAAWLTLARALALAFGPNAWVSVVSGLAIVWLLLIPDLLRVEFRSHEGR